MNVNIGNKCTVSDFICDMRYTTVNGVYENVADPWFLLESWPMQRDDKIPDTCVVMQEIE